MAHWRRSLTRLVATLSTAALIITMPGFPCYQAMAGSFAESTRAGNSVSLHLSLAPVPVSVAAEQAAINSNMGAEAMPLAASPDVEQAAVAAAESADNPQSAMETMPAEPQAEQVAPQAMGLFSRLASMFDRARSRADDDAVSPAARLSAAGDAALVRLMGRVDRKGGRGDRPTPPNPSNGGDEDGGKKPGRALWTIFALGGLGVVGGLTIAAPAAAWLGAHAPAAVAARVLASPAMIRPMAGALVGLAGVSASQFDMWKAFPQRLWTGASTAAVSTYRFWARMGVVFAAVMAGGSVNDAAKQEIPNNPFKLPIMAWPFALTGLGVVPAALGILVGSHMLLPGRLVYGVVFGGAPIAFVVRGAGIAVSTPFLAAYAGLKKVLLEFWPWLKDVIEHFIPFVFGFVKGVLSGLVMTGVGGAMILGAPPASVVGNGRTGRNIDDYSSATRTVLFLVNAALAAETLVFGAVGFVSGIAVGLPVTLFGALAEAFTAARVGGDIGKTFRIWNDETYERYFHRLVKMTSSLSPDDNQPSTLWREVVRPINIALSEPAILILGAIATWFDLALSMNVAVGRATGKEAGDFSPKPGVSQERTPGSAPQTASGSSSLAFVMAMGALGLVGGTLLGVNHGLPAFSLRQWPELAAIMARVIGGGLLGLALAQPNEWNHVETVRYWADQAYAVSRGYWFSLADSFESVLHEEAASKPGRTAAIVKLGGSLVSWGWLIAGGLVGLAAVPGKAAAKSLQQIVDELIPWLNQVLETAARIVRHFVSFSFGAVAGLTTGIIGGAMFGAVLLGRPYFKYIVAQRYDYRGIPAHLGMLTLKSVAIMAGVVFGAVGMAIGVAESIPYAPTLALAFAFRWGDIGGKSQRFFDLWNKVALRGELHRFMQMTNVEASQTDRRVPLGEGWTDLAFKVFPGTLATSIATTLSAWYRYFPSVGRAWGDTRQGKTPPPESDYGDLRAVREGAAAGARAGGWMGFVGGIVFLGSKILLAGAGISFGAAAAAYILGFLPAALVLFFGPVILTGLTAWFAGALIGYVAGGVVGLFVWMAEQFDREPSQP